MAIRGLFPGVDQATESAFTRGLFLVFVPGFIFVFGLIALVIPPRPPVSTVYGCYRLPNSPIIRVGPKFMSVADSHIAPMSISFEDGKEAYTIGVPSGFVFVSDDYGRLHAEEAYPMGQLIEVFISSGKPPALGLIADAQDIKIPKVACPG